MNSPTLTFCIGRISALISRSNPSDDSRWCQNRRSPEDVLINRQRHDPLPSQKTNGIQIRSARHLKNKTRLKPVTNEPTSYHRLRHLFVSRLLGDGYNNRTVQEQLSHRDVSTTMT
ncbi:MAG: hypothetical protein CV089_07530 [Nitrospira sp. WS110]|nr:hypothetical protein [Nitrospira sp. WS110]